MSRDSSEGRLLSEYEPILDGHHRTHRFWSYPPSVRAFALLAAFDSMTLPLELAMRQMGAGVGVAQRKQEYLDALVHAFRFLWQDRWDGNLTPTNDPAITKAAHDFLIHAMDYGLLSDFHIGYNRGLYDLEVSPDTRRVRFVPAARPGSTPLDVGFQEDYPHTFRERGASVSLAIRQEVVRVMSELPHHFEQGRVVIDDLTPLKSDVVRSAFWEFGCPHDIPLNEDDDVGGVTAGEFRLFWLAQTSWSNAATLLHLMANTTGDLPHACVAVQLVSRDQFIAGIANLSGLSPDRVALLLERMTFGAWEQKKPSICLQPLVGGPTAVAWSPYLVELSKAERNLLKLMARGPKQFKCLADTLIGGRERGTAHRFGELFKREYGYQYKTRIQLPDNQGEIDSLAFHTRFPDEVLVVEVKAVLAVDEVNEIHQATQEMKAGQDQLRRVIKFLNRMDQAAKQRLWAQPRWEAVTNYYGLVLTPNSLPNSEYDHREFPTVTLATLARHFRRYQFQSPRAFWEACVSKPWLGPHRYRVREYMPVRVGNVTYELPCSRYKENGQ